MGSAKSLFLLILAISAAAAAAFFLLLDLAFGSSGGCVFLPARADLGRPADLDTAFLELTAAGWLPVGARAVSVGPDPGPAAAAMKRVGFAEVVAASATACCGLPFEQGSFDFAFSAELDRVRVPARVVLEMERVLRPGRLGVVLRLRSGSSRPRGLMRSAAPVATLLRLSDVVGARNVNGSAMVVFRKRSSGGSANAVSECDKTKITKMPLLLSQISESILAAFMFAPSGQLV